MGERTWFSDAEMEREYDAHLDHEYPTYQIERTNLRPSQILRIDESAYTQGILDWISREDRYIEGPHPTHEGTFVYYLKCKWCGKPYDECEECNQCSCDCTCDEEEDDD